MKEDKCPECGADGDSLVFESFEMEEGAQGFFEVACQDCGFIGRQWHRLHFIGWTDDINKDLWNPEQ